MNDIQTQQWSAVVSGGLYHEGGSDFYNALHNQALVGWSSLTMGYGQCCGHFAFLERLMVDIEIATRRLLIQLLLMRGAFNMPAEALHVSWHAPFQTSCRLDTSAGLPSRPAARPVDGT